jgi:hypothetical protein
MVDLAVTVAGKLPRLDDSGEFLATIPHPRQRFGEMYGGIRIMSNPQHQDLPIEFVDAADRTVQAVRHIQWMIGSDANGFRSMAAKA